MRAGWALAAAAACWLWAQPGLGQAGENRLLAVEPLPEGVAGRIAGQTADLAWTIERDDRRCARVCRLQRASPASTLRARCCGSRRTQTASCCACSTRASDACSSAASTARRAAARWRARPRSSRWRWRCARHCGRWPPKRMSVRRWARTRRSVEPALQRATAPAVRAAKPARRPPERARTTTIKPARRARTKRYTSANETQQSPRARIKKTRAPSPQQAPPSMKARRR